MVAMNLQREQGQGPSELWATLKTLDFIPGKYKTLKGFKHREDMSNVQLWLN